MSRCPSVERAWMCDQPEGHTGHHRAALEGSKAARWGFFFEIGCFDVDCAKGPDHPLPHNDGRGNSWVPCDSDDVP